jgi:hypothetical protein
MKKLLAGLLLLPIISTAQAFNFKAGASEKNIVMSLTFSYTKDKAFIEAGSVFHLDRINPAYFGANVGYRFAYVGYYYRLISNDRPKENYFTPCIGARLQHKMLTLEVMHMDKMLFGLVGIKIPLK